LLAFRLLSYQWVATVIQALVSFGLSILVARHLGVDQFGVYAIAMSAGFFITILMDGGFTTLLQRESARASLGDSLEGKNVSRYALGYTFLVVAFLTAVAFINPFGQDAITLFAIIFAFSPVVLIGHSMSILRGQGRLLRDAVLQMVMRFFTAFYVVAFILYGLESPASILFAQGVGGFTAYLTLAFRSRIKPLFFIPWNAFKVALPLAAWAIAFAIYSRSDLLLCRLFDIPRSDVGEYAIACRLVEALQVFSGPVGILIFRKFRIAELSKEVSVKKIMMVTYAALFIGALICIGGFIFSPLAIPWIFGEEYRASVLLFEVLTIGLIFFLGNTVLFQAYIALELERLLMILTALAGIFNVTLNVILLPRYGVEASAWTSVLTQFSLTLLLRFYLLRSVK
jgi:O-antigen/teichoic acid export membrane protein